MRIAVLDYSDQSVDIIDVADGVLKQYKDIEDYLISHCGYNPSSINWMDATSCDIHYLGHDDFAGNEEDE